MKFLLFFQKTSLHLAIETKKIQMINILLTSLNIDINLTDEIFYDFQNVLLFNLWFFIYFWKKPFELTNDKQIISLLDSFNISFPPDLNERRIIPLNEKHKKIHLGKRKDYHATSKKSADEIMNGKILKKGENGMFGPGIYFASNPKIAQQKVRHVHHESDAIVECFVDFGDSLILEESNHNLTRRN